MQPWHATSLYLLSYKGELKGRALKNNTGGKYFSIILKVKGMIKPSPIVFDCSRYSNGNSSQKSNPNTTSSSSSSNSSSSSYRLVVGVAVVIIQVVVLAAAAAVLVVVIGVEV